MREPGVLLHIGFHKTGTTSTQHWLRDHEKLLAKHGVRFPRGWLSLNNHFELPLCLLGQDRMMSARRRADEWKDPSWRTDVLEQIGDDLADHRDWLTILSSEDLCLFRYDDEIGPLRELVGDCEVLAYLRERRSWAASMAGQYFKDGQPGLSDDPDAYNYLKPDSWRLDYETLIAGWQRHFSKVTIRDYDHHTAKDGSVIPSFLHHIDVPIVPDVMWYRLQRRNDPVPYVEGNRLAAGLRFGETSPDHVVEDGLLLSVPR